MAYRPDGSYATQPSGTGTCAQCHKFGGAFTSTNIGAQWDYVFRPDLYFGKGSGAVPRGVLQHYVFVPSTIHAQPGEVVTVYNSDQLLHRIVGDDGSFDTGLMVPGSSFAIRAGNPGTVISFHCTIHSRVKGQIVVDGAAHGRLPTLWASTRSRARRSRFDQSCRRMSSSRDEAQHGWAVGSGPWALAREDWMGIGGRRGRCVHPRGVRRWIRQHVTVADDGRYERDEHNDREQLAVSILSCTHLKCGSPRLDASNSPE